MKTEFNSKLEFMDSGCLLVSFRMILVNVNVNACVGNYHQMGFNVLQELALVFNLKFTRPKWTVGCDHKYRTA